MAWEQNPYALKLTCSPDVSTMGGQLTNTNSSAPMTQFSFVYLTGAANPGSNQNAPLVGVVSAASTRPLGVVQNAPKVRYNALGVVEGVDEAEVTISGITKVIAGGLVSVGDAITVNASGQAVSVKFGIGGTTQTATITNAVASGTQVVYTTSSTTAFTVGQTAIVTGIVATGSGSGSLNVEGLITAVGGSSGSYTFTVANPAASTITYSSGGSVNTAPADTTDFVVGTALSSSAAAGDYITAAIACHNAGRAA